MGIKLRLLKFGSVVCFIVGFLLSVLSFLLAMAMIFQYEEVDLYKKALVIGGLLIFSLISFVISWTILELASEVVGIRSKVGDIFEEGK